MSTSGSKDLSAPAERAPVERAPVERAPAPTRWRTFWRSKLTTSAAGEPDRKPATRARLGSGVYMSEVRRSFTPVVETHHVFDMNFSGSKYRRNNFISAMGAHPAFELDAGPDGIMPVVLQPVLSDYTLYNTEPETPPIPDITAIYSKTKHVSHRIGNGWAPTLDSERKDQSQTVQPKTGEGESSHNDPLETNKMPWVRKGKEWVKQYRIRPRGFKPPPPRIFRSSFAGYLDQPRRLSTTLHRYRTPISTVIEEENQWYRESTDPHLDFLDMVSIPQPRSTLQSSETLQGTGASMVPEKPHAKYPIRLSKGKERALSEQPIPDTLSGVSAETDSPQIQSLSQIPEALENIGPSLVSEKALTQYPTPLNRAEAPAISEKPSPYILSGVSMETDSPQVQSLSQIPEVLEDIETSRVPGEPPEKYPERLSKGKERALSEQTSPDTLKGVSTEENSPKVQSFPQISGLLGDMEASLDSENSNESQDLPSSDYKSAGIVERMPLVIISEVHAGDETDSSSSSPHDLFRNGIEFKPYHRDWFDVGGIWLERNLDTQVCWWPLRSPIPPEESGLTRMSWKCGCGSILSSVISNKTIGRYHSPSSSAGKSSGSVRTAGTSQVSGQLPTRPSAVLATHGRLPSTQTASGIPAPSLTGNIIANLGTFILCCIRKRQHRTVLVQMDRKTFSNDREFFWNLRVEYRGARGWKRWLSLSCVARIKFIKFVRYYLDYVDCQEFEELPPHTNHDYEYIPKPPENPPVFPVAEFMHYFERPDCAGTATDCLDLVPKRVVGPLGKGRRVEGWGIQPMEGLSMWKFISLLAIVWLGTLAFATWWLVVHPNDFQNAFVPATWAASFAAIGVILPEVLKRYHVLGSIAGDAKFPPNLRNLPRQSLA